MRPFDAIIFDLGSTLIYFDGAWPTIMAQADAALYDRLAEAGVDLDRDAFLANYHAQMEAYYRERESEFVEYTTQNVLRQLLAEWGYPDISDDVLRQALKSFYAISQAHWQVEEDTIHTLETLRGQGYLLGMISNASDDLDVQTLVDNAGVRAYFDIILTSAAEGIRKPNPKIFQKVLAYWELKPERVVMVGDTLGADILGAHNAGIYAIWIRRRAENPANQAHADTIHPDATILALSDLPDLLDRLGREMHGENEGKER